MRRTCQAQQVAHSWSPRRPSLEFIRGGRNSRRVTGRTRPDSTPHGAFGSVSLRLRVRLPDYVVAQRLELRRSWPSLGSWLVNNSRRRGWQLTLPPRDDGNPSQCLYCPRRTCQIDELVCLSVGSVAADTVAARVRRDPGYSIPTRYMGIK